MSSRNRKRKRVSDNDSDDGDEEPTELARLVAMARRPVNPLDSRAMAPPSNRKRGRPKKIKLEDPNLDVKDTKPEEVKIKEEGAEEGEPKEDKERDEASSSLPVTETFDPRFLGTDDYQILKTAAKKARARVALLKKEKVELEQKRDAALANPRAFYEDLLHKRVSLPPAYEKARESEKERLRDKDYKVPKIDFDKYPKKKVKKPKAEEEEKGEKGEKVEGEEKDKEGVARWTSLDQRLFEKLLVKHPEKTGEPNSIRVERISRELPGKNVKQVYSHMIKYFTRLYQAGLPVPGTLPKSAVEMVQKRAAKDKEMEEEGPLPAPNIPGERNKTSNVTYFKPPKILIADGPISALQRPQVEKIVPVNKRGRGNSSEAVHLGYACDSCAMEPIKGPRWSCLECPEDFAVDLCKSCHKKAFKHSHHKTSHKMERIDYAESRPYYEENDWSDDEENYAYLDPNFMPT